MKKIIFILFIISNSYSAFEYQNFTARAIVFNDSYVAISDESGGSFYNPAGIAKINNFEIGGTYALLNTGLELESQNIFCFNSALKIKNIGNFAFNWASLNIKSLYSENSFVLTYATKITNLFKINETTIKDMHLGINLKYLGHSYYMKEIDFDPVFENKNSKYSFTIDTGILNTFYIKNIPFNFGLSIFNILPGDVGLIEKESLPLTIKLGVSHYLQHYDFLKFFRKENTILAFGISYKMISEMTEYYDISLAWENTFFNKIFVFRTGFNLESFNFGLGINYKFNNLIKNFMLDYSFTFPFYIKNTNGTHTISTMIKF